MNRIEQHERQMAKLQKKFQKLDAEKRKEFGDEVVDKILAEIDAEYIAILAELDAESIAELEAEIALIKGNEKGVHHADEGNVQD